MMRATRTSQSGQSWVISTSVISPNSVDWATSGQSHTEVATFTDFQFDDRDRLSTWTVNDKSPLSELVDDLGTTKRLGVMKIEALTGYRNTNRALEVTYRVKSGRESGTAMAQEYVTGGRSRRGQNTPYQMEIGTSGAVWGSSIFPKSDWGGALTFTSYLPQSTETSIQIDPPSAAKKPTPR